MGKEQEMRAIEAAEAAYGKSVGGMLDGRPMENAVNAYLAARRSSDEQVEVVEIGAMLEAAFHEGRESTFGTDRHYGDRAWQSSRARSRSDGLKLYRAPSVVKGGVTEERVGAAARALAADHYAHRFQKTEDDPHVVMNVDANWQIFSRDAKIALTAALAVGDEGIREGVTGTGSVDVLRELAREEVALGYADHAKWLRYAANRLSSFDALRIAAALAGSTPPTRGEGE